MRHKVIKRFIDAEIAEWLSSVPAVMISGARYVGKTTTAASFAKTVLSLDKGDYSILRDDPDTALKGLQEPIFIDEWQHLPAIVNTVKRTVDANPSPNRFLLAGSVESTSRDPRSSAPGRFRMIRIYPLTVAEIKGIPTKPLFDRLTGRAVLNGAGQTLERDDYLRLAIRGGFPRTVSLSDRQVQIYLTDYVDTILKRDFSQVAGPQTSTAGLLKYFQIYAECSGRATTDSKIYQTAGIDAKTAAHYKRILKNLYLIEELEPWFPNRPKRLKHTSDGFQKAPKRLLVDSGLMAASMQTDVQALIRQGHLMGNVLETFVLAQLRAEASVAECWPRLYHLRNYRRREIDLVAETKSGDIIAIEIKSKSTPGKDDADHIAWFRDEVGERFLAGLVLHTGPYSYSLGDRIRAVPISTLWSGQT